MRVGRVLDNVLCSLVGHNHLFFIILLQKLVSLLRWKLHDLLMCLVGVHHLWGLLMVVIKYKLVGFDIRLLRLVEVWLAICQDRPWVPLLNNWILHVKCWWRLSLGLERVQGCRLVVLILVLSCKLRTLEVYQGLLERRHDVLTRHVGVQLLLVLLHLLLVKRLKSYNGATHHISLLLVIVDMVPYLVEPDACGASCSHWWRVPEEELPVVGTSKCPFSFAVPLSC